MPSRIPTIPNRFPQRIMASSTQMPGRPIEVPTTSGINKIAFDLLQNQEKNQISQSVPGIYQKKDKAGSEHRNVRPNDRDQAAKGHNSADQQSIGKPENRHAQIDEENQIQASVS